MNQELQKELIVICGNQKVEFSSGTHTGINLMQYSNKKFKEYFYFVSDEGDTTFNGEDDDVRDDVVVLRSATKKLEIIYVIED